MIAFRGSSCSMVNLGQLEIHHTVFHILRNLIQLLFIQSFHHFLDILALIWQKYQHTVTTITIRKIYSLEILVLCIEELLYDASSLLSGCHVYSHGSSPA